MKKFAFLSIWLLAINCAKPVKEKPEMVGTYKMISQSAKSDSAEITSVRTQLKFYTGDYMIYTSFNAPDSVSSFGVASYTAEPGGVTENIFYTATGTTANSTATDAKLEIEKTAKGYKQVIRDITIDKHKYALTEEYEATGSGKASPVDGLWQNIKIYTIKGKDTSTFDAIDYKAYQNGLFMFGHAFLDSAKVLHTGMAFGSFEMTGDNKLKETIEASNYKEIRSKSFDIEFEMKNPDEYKQTIKNEDGTWSVELYKRIKK